MRTISLTILLALLAPALAPALPSSAARAAAEATRTIDVVVDGGYTPSRITVRAGERVTLRFVRREYTPCTSEVVFPTLGIRRALPTDELVLVELPALDVGRYAFHCGMNMIHGTIVVLPQ